MARARQNSLFDPLSWGRKTTFHGKIVRGGAGRRQASAPAARVNRRKTIRYQGVSIIPVEGGEWTISIDRDSRFDNVKDARAVIRHFRENPSAFEKCVRAVTAKGSADDPRAVCAVAGVRKYGQKEMTRRAVAGKKKAAKRNAGPKSVRKSKKALKKEAPHLYRQFRGPRKPGKRNPQDAAAAMYEKFHGRPATKVETFTESVHEHGWLAKMGRLLYLLVKVNPREGKLLEFGNKGVRCACTENGGQIYFVGGDMEVDLSVFPGLKRTLPKDHVELGPCIEIGYHTQKGFHKFEPTDYFHKFGKPDGEAPMLNYDVLNNRPYLVGGTYQVKPEGIVR